MTADQRSGPVFRQPGTVLTDHVFMVPLDHERPGGEQIEVFAREVAPAGRRGGDPALPWLVYFQGGPGFGSPRPFGRESWLNRALDDYRVLLLDQRGTGRSTPASRHTLGRLGTPAAQAGYLGHFRADSIVRDDGDITLLFTGEMIYPWMFETDPVLRPLRDAAGELAARDSWPRLYDPARLAASDVPAAAAVYFDDMYVPRQLSLPTAAAVRGLRPWVTNEYQHDGLGTSSGAVLDRLIALARGAA